MKKKSTLFLLLISLLITTNIFAQNKIPELNKKILKYVKSVKGKKVDRGECWDLAYQALNRVDADWDKAFVYGDLIDPLKDKVYPGDLIQFKNVKTRFTEGNTTYTSSMGQHTAIVYKVLDKGVYKIAHQNTQFSGRKVGVNTFNLNHVIQGDIYFYRPTKNRKND